MEIKTVVIVKTFAILGSIPAKLWSPNKETKDLLWLYKGLFCKEFFPENSYNFSYNPHAGRKQHKPPGDQKTKIDVAIK